MRPTLKKTREPGESERPLVEAAARPACPLCLSGRTRHFLRTTERAWGARNYLKCTCCGLIFMAPAERLGPAEEKARYDLHRNDPREAGYVSFLRRLAGPLAERLRPGSRGLDYGCGPGPGLAGLLERHGHTVCNFDPFYFPDHRLLERRYDFIACTEVLEHLFSPREVFQRFERLLDGKGAILGIMTGVLERERDFENWWYRRDPTHVAFYRRSTFEWVAGWRGWRVEFPAANVIIYTT